jgi:hypothetical protein
MTLAVASNVHRRKAVWGSKAAGFALALAVAASASCGKTREGTGNSFLIMTALEGAAGDAPTEFGGTLRSDVITVVEDVPTVFNDIGRARFTLGLKDPGTASAPTVPSQFDFITINRYRVRFVRADGRNTPGVDVPFGFDGAVTVTVTGGETTAGFEIVRHSLKHHRHDCRSDLLRAGPVGTRGDRQRPDDDRFRQLRRQLTRTRTGREGREYI